ncbi:uncharacterized protein LOC144882743 [Branchiostoma floridae x Branchiostoma japonicum]
MWKKLRHVLIFLLVLLNESKMSEAWCGRDSHTCRPDRPGCWNKRNFTSIPQNIEHGELISLSLQHNLMTKIQPDAFVKLSRINELDLLSNHITNIPAGTFAPLCYLHSLCLARNRIAMIQNGTFAGLRRLKKLSMAHNRITRIESGAFAELSQLSVIDLSFNQITTIQAGTFVDLPRLLKLSMKNNKIAKIDPGVFAELPWLQMLILSSNQITMIRPSTFAELPGLFTLELDSNQITMIRTGTFADLPSLRNLCLESNQITEIQPCAFVNLPQLQVKLDNEREHMLEGSICEKRTISTLSVDIQTSFQSSSVSTSSPFGSTEINAGPTGRPEGFTSATQSSFGPMQSANNSYNGTVTSRYHWYFKRDFGSTASSAGNTSQARATPPSLLAITSDKPEIRSSHELSANLPNAVLIASICGSIAGIILIGSIILTIWCKRRTSRPPLGLNPNVVSANTSTTVSVMTSGQNENENKEHYQTGCGNTINICQWS